MKTRSFLTLLCCSLLWGATARGQVTYDDAHRFVFYAVLEGCYEDGLSHDDVDRILMKRADGYRMHFIYACPLCTPALHAFNAYRSQPGFEGMKNPNPTFGHGLEPDLRKQLYSEKTEDRLIAINTLVQRWIKRRMSLVQLSAEDRERLVKSLEKKRDEGTKILKESLAKPAAGTGEEKPSPAYAAKECAICNAAVGMDLKLDK